MVTFVLVFLKPQPFRLSSLFLHTLQQESSYTQETMYSSESIQ